jgi:hypothetical protein
LELDRRKLAMFRIFAYANGRSVIDNYANAAWTLDRDVTGRLITDVTFHLAGQYEVDE